jgi:hypothetical protein
MNQEERRARTAGISTAMLLGGIIVACIIKLIITLV